MTKFFFINREIFFFPTLSYVRLWGCHLRPTPSERNVVGGGRKAFFQKKKSVYLKKNFQPL